MSVEIINCVGFYQEFMLKFTKSNVVYCCSQIVHKDYLLLIYFVLSIAILFPTGKNNTLTCMEDGLWSFPEALCELRCLAPPPVPNAVLQTKRCNETDLKVGTLCKYKCRPGYHVTNKSKR